MSEPDNKFAEMMQTARKHQATDHKTSSPVKTPKASTRPPVSSTPPKGGRGRPATGKRSDPDYESTTVFLRRVTKTGAAHILLDREEDLSDVLENLLAGWVRKNSQL